MELGPGLLGQVYDGLQNPLHARRARRLLPAARQHIRALPRDQVWEFTPRAAAGDRVRAGDTLGTVPEGIFEHRIMVPFGLGGAAKVPRSPPPASTP